MHNHTSAGLKGTRQGSTPVLHSFPLAYTDTVAAKKVTIVASTKKPIRVRIGFITKTAFDGTTPTVSVGTTSTANELLNGVTPAGAGVDFATPVTRLLTADTDIYAKAAGGGSNTVGDGFVTLTIEEINVLIPTNQ
jgi:hypothetical protein